MLVLLFMVFWYAIVDAEFSTMIAMSLILGLPLIVAFFLDYGDCFRRMANPWNLICFLLAMPTHIAVLNAYSVARLTDLTWGTRPDAGKSGQPSKGAAAGKSLLQRSTADTLITSCCCRRGCTEPALAPKQYKRWWRRWQFWKRQQKGDEFYTVSFGGLCAEHSWLHSMIERCFVLNGVLVSCNVFAFAFFSRISPVAIVIINSMHLVYQACSRAPPFSHDLPIGPASAGACSYRVGVRLAGHHHLQLDPPPRCQHCAEGLRGRRPRREDGKGAPAPYVPLSTQARIPDGAAPTHVSTPTQRMRSHCIDRRADAILL